MAQSGPTCKPRQQEWQNIALSARAVKGSASQESTRQWNSCSFRIPAQKSMILMAQTVFCIQHSSIHCITLSSGSTYTYNYLSSRYDDATLSYCIMRWRKSIECNMLYYCSLIVIGTLIGVLSFARSSFFTNSESFNQPSFHGEAEINFIIRTLRCDGQTMIGTKDWSIRTGWWQS